ncbi:MAG: acyltransferase family protein [Planctomycetaceae bacterium]
MSHPTHSAAESGTSARRDDLDALRGFAMVLGIMLHASLAYFPFPWSVQDSRQSKVFGLVYAVIHGFRMPLFFLLSGFFTMLVLERRGLRALLAQRALRIFVPLVVASLTILPLTGATVTLAVRRTAAAAAAASPLVSRILAGDRDGVSHMLATSAVEFGPDLHSGATPLSLAAMGGDTSVVTALLDAGAPIDGPNRDGSTPLHAAAFMGQADVVRLLLERGANPTAANSGGDLPRDSAAAPAAIAADVAEFLGLPARSAMDVQHGREAIIGILSPETAAAESPGLIAMLVARYHAVLASPHLQCGLLDHLWFLWYLCLMVGALAVAEAAGLGPSGRLRWWLVPASCLPFAMMRWPFGPDTALGLIPPPHLILFYACFFWFGAGTFRCEGLATPLGRHWKIVLPLSLLVILPAGLATIGRPPFPATLQPAFAWGMSLGLIGLFHQWMARPSPAVRWLADASYWMYLAHLPLVIILQSYACDLAWPAVAKFTAVNVVTVTVLLITYRWCVRDTPIGWLLNGPRSPPRRG